MICSNQFILKEYDGSIMHLSMSCGGGGGGGGGDLIVFVGPGVGHLTDLIVARWGGGMFGSFFAQREDI